MKIFEKRPNGTLRVAKENPTPDKGAQQQFKDDCDINRIVSKYRQTGEWHHVTRSQGFYGDVSEISDYHSSMDKVINANKAFMQLPSDLRLRFDNDPGKLIEFMSDPRNYEEGVELGIYDRKQSKILDEKLNDDLNDKINKSKKQNNKPTDPSPTPSTKGSTPENQE